MLARIITNASVDGSLCDHREETKSNNTPPTPTPYLCISSFHRTCSKLHEVCRRVAVVQMHSSLALEDSQAHTAISVSTPSLHSNQAGSTTYALPFFVPIFSNRPTSLNLNDSSNHFPIHSNLSGFSNGSSMMRFLRILTWSTPSISSPLIS